MGKSLVPRLGLFFACAVALAPLNLNAEGLDTDASGIVVRIRAIRASDKAAGEDGVERAVPEGALQIDSRISDISTKLKKLHFRSFKLVSSQREVVPLGKRETITLIDGNHLTIRPLTVENRRVALWINWQDASGMQVLDTRMHFDCGQSMLTGVDGAQDNGLILAIDVSPGEDNNVPVVQPVVGK